MLKTILVLPDGRELSSGPGAACAVQSCTVTECVNAGTELTPGAVCAAMAELKLFAPAGSLTISAGDRLKLYQGDGTDKQQLGIFIAEKPDRPTAHTMTVTAYDPVSLLDKDLTGWLEGLTGWPYALYDLAAMVCKACGLTLSNAQIPNGSFPVEKFSARGVTGRKLLQWAAQAAGCFGRATAAGDIEFAWYEPLALGIAAQPGADSWRYAGGSLCLADPAVTVSAAGDTVTLSAAHWQVAAASGTVTVTDPGSARQWYFQGGLSYADYTVAPIEKVQIGQTEEDVGAVWPDDPAATNTCRITGNPLLAGADSTALEALAQSLYEHLKDVTYTPCRVELPACPQLRAGHIVGIADKNGRLIRTYVMSKKRTGQTDTIESTGSHRRDAVTAVNEQSYTALAGKVLNLRTDMDGIQAENKAADGRLSALALTVDGLSAQTEKQTAEADQLRRELTMLQQTADAVKISVQAIRDNGVSKVQTGMGYTFDDEGLRIAREGQQMENLLDNTGMHVTRGGEVILQACSDGVVATDVRVRNYLNVGASRLESYETGRTACFYTGG